MHGGDAGLAHLFQFKFENNIQQQFVIKCNGEDENSFREWTKYREAIWYEEWAPELRQRVWQESNQQFRMNIPMTYCSVVDPSSGRYFNIMEYKDNHRCLDEVFREGDQNKFREMTGSAKDANVDNVFL